MRIVHKNLEQVKPHRDIYHSTIFALSSAALAFMSQYINKENSYSNLLIVSVISFVLALIFTIFIYYLRILHTISWNYVSDHIEKKEFSDLLKSKDTNDKKTLDAFNDSFDLMVTTAYLDVALLVCLLAALGSYSTFLILNI